MASLEITFLHNQLEERKRRLETAIALAPQNGGLAGLLREVDSALERMAKGNYGLCEECHETVEQERLLADPLVRYCLDHLTGPQRDALQRDLDLASEVQRKLLPQAGLRAGRRAGPLAATACAAPRRPDRGHAATRRVAARSDGRGSTAPTGRPAGAPVLLFRGTLRTGHSCL